MARTDPERTVFWPFLTVFYVNSLSTLFLKYSASRLSNAEPESAPLGGGFSLPPPQPSPGCVFFAAAAFGPRTDPNGPRTNPARPSNGSRADHERIPHGPRTDPEQTSNGPRADLARSPNGAPTDPERTLGHQNLLREAVIQTARTISNGQKLRGQLRFGRNFNELNCSAKKLSFENAFRAPLGFETNTRRWRNYIPWRCLNILR